MESIELTSSDLAVTLKPNLGGRISSIRFRGVELLIQESSTAPHDPVFAGSYVMAPFAGRIRHGKFEFENASHEIPLCPGHEHAMHGYALDRAWQVLERTSHRLVLQIELDERWPFGGIVEQSIELDENILKQEIRFRAATKTPVWLGWHPWWKRQPTPATDAQLYFSAEQMLNREGALPTGEIVAPKAQPWDDAFTELGANPRIIWPGVGQVEMTSSESWWVVYNERDDAICVEPQSGPPNAIELGLAPIIDAGEEHAISSSWIFTSS